MPDTLDQTTRGDLIADKVRAWYEAHRESWWARRKPSADRKHIHADNFMLELVAVVNAAERDTPR